jgi:hypothetical protein
MLNIRQLLIISFLLLVISCNNENNTYIKNFPKQQTLNAIQVPINEIIKAGNIYKSKDYIILRDIQTNAKYNFYVYSLSSFHFLYSFCPIGTGPGEYLMPTVIKNMPENRFAFRDHATDKYVSYLLTDTCAIMEEEFYLPSLDNRFFWEMNYVDTTQYLTKRSNSKSSTRELWNIKQRLLLDTLPNTFNLTEDLGKDYYTEFDDTWITVSGNHFASAYFFIDRIEFGEIRNGKLYLTGKIGVDFPPKFYLFNRNTFGSKFKYNVDNNIVRYEDLSCTQIGIYALYSGIPWGDSEKIHSSSVEVYDWKGNPIKRLLLNNNISSLIVDEKYKCIYGINLETNEDAILKFNLK